MDLGTGVKLLDEKTEVFVTYYGQKYPVTSMVYEMGTKPCLVLEFNTNHFKDSE